MLNCDSFHSRNFERLLPLLALPLVKCVIAMNAGSHGRRCPHHGWSCHEDYFDVLRIFGVESWAKSLFTSSRKVGLLYSEKSCLTQLSTFGSLIVYEFSSVGNMKWLCGRELYLGKITLLEFEKSGLIVLREELLDPTFNIWFLEGEESILQVQMPKKLLTEEDDDGLLIVVRRRACPSVSDGTTIDNEKYRCRRHSEDLLTPRKKKGCRRGGRVFGVLCREGVGNERLLGTEESLLESPEVFSSGKTIAGGGASVRE
ncbi:hypothetical protein KSP40_PGU011010 [Platanthera guangdongensis]|uniref:Uncharacterized protein n=1 Tax=Platanthera guangdongensis TaxID=2320717 RepID=A0ABR2LJ11_9ASPA